MEDRFKIVVVGLGIGMQWLAVMVGREGVENACV
jgi:hypothetical protein